MDRTDNPRRVFLACVALAAVTLATFGPVFHNCAALLGANIIPPYAGTTEA
jgi:hypothetical protein